MKISEESEESSEEVSDIISNEPSWILKNGASLIFLILFIGGILSAFIKYPDHIKVELKVSSLNAPKVILAKQTGKVVHLLVKEGSIVKKNQPLSFMESLGNHMDILKLRNMLIQINKVLIDSGIIKEIKPINLNLGELQEDYKNFYVQYLEYASTQNGGYYLTKRDYLEKDLQEIKKLKDQIIEQQETQKIEYENLEFEFEAYKKLFEKGVISKSEYKQQENKFLSSRYPLQQSVSSLINNRTAHISKQKEIYEIENAIKLEKSNFTQVLVSFIAKVDAWINLYISRASIDGKLGYAGMVQENQIVNSGQELFIINPGNDDFFGEVYIPQYNMGKVKIGQRVLIKMKSFPFEQFGGINGKVNYISDAAFKDNLFIARVKFEKNRGLGQKIFLKNGMEADAEIIIEESSLLERFLRNIIKTMNTANR